jgi:hypothetical protein
VHYRTVVLTVFRSCLLSCPGQVVGLLDVRWHLVVRMNVLLYGASECFCITVHWEGDLVLPDDGSHKIRNMSE